ncbi:MAG: hypothetical protein JWN74_664 [Acidobacteriaceae bacterium]|nr:hypothetical protein [Acidobacteriaceae bacterium]
MRLRAIHLTLAALLVCSDSALSLSVPQAQATPQIQAPNQEPQTPTQPVQTPAPSPAQTAPPAATQTPTPAPMPPKPPVLRHRKRKRVGKTGSPIDKKTPAHKSSSETSKVVVRNGGAKEGLAQLTPATSPGQAQQQRASTAWLLAATDANLKRVAGRPLTPAQQSMIDEIHTYMRQAKAAAASADTNRAQTLAYKARLLSDELARK